MSPSHSSILMNSLVLATASIFLPMAAPAHSGTAASSPQPKAVLVELFTSESCSSCPPADELLQQVAGHNTPEGQLIVGVSEHVSYWNGLGWKDPYSSELYTGRQNDYSARFGLDGVYTPQMVVNGREQFVGSDRRALEAAFASEAKRKQIELQVTSAQVTRQAVTFSYSAADLPANTALQLVVLVVDDMDKSNVLRGENSGRELTHVAVARALASLGILHETEKQTVRLPLPPYFAQNSGTGHHVVLFAQQGRAGAVLGVASRSI